MAIIMKTEELNQTLLEIWKKAELGSPTSRLPLFRSSLKPDCLLFVGINPSFSENGLKRLHKGEDIDIHEFYKYPPAKDEIDIEQHLALEKSASNSYAYYGKFENLADCLKLDWNHLDLLSVRETNQALIRKTLFDNLRNPLPFAESQLRVSEAILRQSQPVAIVVANAFASGLFKKRFELTFDHEAGCYRLALGNRSVPVFLTSMLTGQRALDTFSYERLIWHIRFVLENGSVG